MIPLKYFFSLVILSFLTGSHVSCNKDDNSFTSSVSIPTVTSTSEPDGSNPEAKVERDIAYDSDRQQVYDIYLPKGRTQATTKSVVLIHGGGWTSGDKSDMGIFISLLQQDHPELAIINLNYKLATNGYPALPNQLQDITKAFEHITSRLATYQISNEFAIVGTSAGAHLGMLYGLQSNANVSIKMITNIVGPVDFTDPSYTNNPAALQRQTVEILTGSQEVPELAFLKQFSPVTFVTSDAPPLLSFYGNKDQLIPNSQHQRLDAAYKQAGVLHDLTVYNGGHTTLDPLILLNINTKLNTFISKYLLE